MPREAKAEVRTKEARSRGQDLSSSGSKRERECSPRSGVEPRSHGDRHSINVLWEVLYVGRGGDFPGVLMHMEYEVAPVLVLIMQSGSESPNAEIPNDALMVLKFLCWRAQQLPPAVAGA